MIHKTEYVSIEIHKNIPRISVNWKNENMKCILANEQFNFECIKFNPLIIKENDALPSMYRIIVEELMKKFSN